MAYLKDKKITFIGKTVRYDDYGVPKTTTGPIEGLENIWAYYRQASASEFFGAAQTERYQVDAIFKIAWRDNITNTMRILFRGKEYAITRIDDFEGNKEDLTIYAYRLD